MAFPVLESNQEPLVSLSNSTERIDPLGIDALLGDEERAIQSTVRRYFEERISPQIGEWYERGHRVARAAPSATYTVVCS